MTIAIPERSEVVVQQYEMQSQAVARLADWAHSAKAAYEVATSLVQTSFVPEAFRNKPHEATAAILAGAEVGLSPMAALRSFDVIQGTAAPRAITLRAIVQSQGHEMILTESTATRAKMKGKRRGSSEWVEVVWTIDRAKDLNLTGKPNWKNQPATMLVARCTSELARLIAADAILGIGYTVEELSDGTVLTEATQVSEPVAESGSRRMSRTTGRTQTDDGADPGREPAGTAGAVGGSSPPMSPAPSSPDMITDPQIRKLGVVMKEAGITDRDDALAYVQSVIDRPVASRKELTKDEASHVIDRLEQLKTPPADDQAAPEETS